MKKNVIVIGAGYAGLSAATHLAHAGWDVTILEKNQTAGGRSRVFRAEGFTFDMGPSWYWMPDVFEHYFGCFGKKTSDYYTLQRLDPSYRVVFDKEDQLDIPASLDELFQLFESIEKGSGVQLQKFLDLAAYKYKVGINQLVYKPSRSIFEFVSLRLLLDVLRMDIFQSFHKHIRKFFKDKRLLQLMEFPILFLGATAQKTPALYSLMNYADIKLGTWYPIGGMHKVIEGMVSLAQDKGVKILYDQEVQQVEISSKKMTKVLTQGQSFEADYYVAATDYHHFDQQILPKAYQNYDQKYWDQRTMAPSSLIFYLGLNQKLQDIKHHTLFFEGDLNTHAHEIYEDPQWPSDPSFYLSCPSQTDPSVAPEGHENLFLLIPVAPGIEDTMETRAMYFDMIISKLERLTGQSIKEHIIYKRSYAHHDFVSDYHAFKGNAYGLANTLRQTAILKPRLNNKKIQNLYYTGQLTVPGPGVPPCLISGEVVASQILKSQLKL